MPRSGFVMHTAKKDSFTGDGLQTQVSTSSNSYVTIHGTVI